MSAEKAIEELAAAWTRLYGTTLRWYLTPPTKQNARQADAECLRDAVAFERAKWRAVRALERR